MREEMEQQALIPQPLMPVDVPFEARKMPRWMRWFFTENASPDAVSLMDLQRRACWIGVALILQALNEVPATHKFLAPLKINLQQSIKRNIYS